MWDARSLAFALLWSLLPAGAAAAAVDLADEGEKLGLRLRPRKANLDLLLGGVTGSGARCGGCGGTGSGGGGVVTCAIAVATGDPSSNGRRPVSIS